MKWEPWGTYAERTSCERYAVSACKVMGKWKYTAWKLPAERLSNHATAEAAKAAITHLDALMQSQGGFVKTTATNPEATSDRRE